MEDFRTVHEVVDGISASIIGVTIVICLMRTVIFIVKTLKQRASQKSKYEIYSRMIDKFGAAPEFIAFMQTEEGRAILEENLTPTDVATPLNKILVSIQIGVILTLLGSGLLALGNIFGSSRGGDLYIVLNIGGTASLMVGVGFLISSAISYKLCKTWGILTADKINLSKTENK